MDKRQPGAEIEHELAALPSDLQPLYRRLADDGSAWQAASAQRLAALAQVLTDDVERMVKDVQSNLTLRRPLSRETRNQRRLS